MRLRSVLCALASALLFSIALGCGAQTVSLSGTGTAPPTPALTVNATSIAFGSVNIGQTQTQSLQLNSTGTANAVISALTVQGTEFSVSGLTLPATLAPGAQATLSVEFMPTVLGPEAGSLDIISNASVSPAPLVTITGTVVNPASYEVQLSWTAPTGSADPAVGYHVYRAAANTSVYSLLDSSLVTVVTYTDTTVVAGQTYTYIVKSVDANGVESLPSNVYTAAIP